MPPANAYKTIKKELKTEMQAVCPSKQNSVKRAESNPVDHEALAHDGSNDCNAESQPIYTSCF